MQDKTMIEVQAKVIANTDPSRHMVFIPVDKHGSLFAVWHR